MTEPADWSDLEAQLHETRTMLEEVEQRFAQIMDATIAKQELQQQRSQLRSQMQEIQNSSDAADPAPSPPQSKIRRKPNSASASPSSQDQGVLKLELQEQLQTIGDRLEQVEAELESRLIAWSSLREPFWQIVRFGGLGIVIGVILKSCTG